MPEPAAASLQAVPGSANVGLDGAENLQAVSDLSAAAQLGTGAAPAAEGVMPETLSETGVGGGGELLAQPGTDTLAQTLLDRLVEFLVVGGPVVWILCVFSIVALTIVLVKIAQFALLRAERCDDVEQALALWRAGKREQAPAALRPNRPVSTLVAIAMQGMGDQSRLALLREELTRVANRQLQQLRAFLRPLEVIATLSPLLGLLGTVLGMITAFQQMEAAGSQVDPSVLSGGIWQALLTTAVGLAVAIPVVTLHAWLERKVERVAASMNDAVTRVFTSAGPQATPATVAAGALRDAA